MHMFFDFVCKSRRKWNASGTGTAASAIEFEERRVSEVAFGIFFAAVEISGRENGPRAAACHSVGRTGMNEGGREKQNIQRVSCHSVQSSPTVFIK